MKEIKRFRLWDIENQAVILRTDSLEECALEILKKDSLIWSEFFVEDLIDDIEVNCEELMSVWESGERPGDLQMF